MARWNTDPIILFFAAYTFLKDQTFMVAGTSTRALSPSLQCSSVLVLATLALWKLTGHLSKMQIVTLVLVIGFGGLSIWFNDERFFKMKPTMIYLLFAGLLGFGLMRGESYLEAVMDKALPLEREGWMLLTKRLAIFFLLLAVANEAIWRMMSTDAWVNFKTFGLPAATFGFFMSQAGLFKRFGTEEDAS